MSSRDTDLLGRLGDGETIEAVCAEAGMTQDEFDAWWRRTTQARAAARRGEVQLDVTAQVTIERDEQGIPHIFAENDHDLFYGFGWAMAEDRLFQLDWLRRRGLGRLAEIIGPEGVELDTIARTVGLNRIAAAEWERLSPAVQQTLKAFSAGINAYIASCEEGLFPIEFDLLRYRPEPWSPIDCLAIENEFRWYLTGRFPIICMPELAKRVLGPGPLYQDYLLGECDAESILHPGEYPRDANGSFEPVGETVNDPDATTGSNNWVLAGSRTVSGHPLLGSDPHIAFDAVSCWYEAHLYGGSFHVAGMAYVGMPAIMVGRNERVAWGITNNICSQRDLYQEQTDDAHPGCFLYDGQWEAARQLEEVIKVRGGEPITKTIRFSRNGPIVDEILPPPANETGPVALKWLGASQGGWLTAMLDMDQAKSAAEFRAALRPWHVPTFSMVFADVEGRIGYQSSGRIPQRSVEERGYRPGWDPEHQWLGLIPFEEMPGLDAPARGWIATANNRVAPPDFPRPLTGRWSSGWRAQRIRQMIDAREKHAPTDMRDMHQDCMNLRAADTVESLVATLREHGTPDMQPAIECLAAWDFQSTADSVAAAIFNVFFTHWCRHVAAARFDAAAVPLMSKGVEGCATRLLAADHADWFDNGDRVSHMVAAFTETLHDLADRCGPDMKSWTWGKLHRLPLRHWLSSRGDLGKLLDHGGDGVRGDMSTVCNTGPGPDWLAVSGAGYRLVADLSTSPPALMAIDAQSQSGQSGSPHYGDQFSDWIAGKYHVLKLEKSPGISDSALVLVPRT